MPARQSVGKNVSAEEITEKLKAAEDRRLVSYILFFFPKIFFLFKKFYY